MAARSGVSRPNLSAIEQGARDLTIGTLRRIALVLGVSAGALVDGIGPWPVIPRSLLGRDALDRIAKLATGQSLRASALERRIAKDLASIMKSKMRLLGPKKNRGNVRANNPAMLRLKSELGQVVFENLIRRVEKMAWGIKT